MSKVYVNYIAIILFFLTAHSTRLLLNTHDKFSWNQFHQKILVKTISCKYCVSIAKVIKNKFNYIPWWCILCCRCTQTAPAELRFRTDSACDSSWVIDIFELVLEILKLWERSTAKSCLAGETSWFKLRLLLT